MVGAISAGRLYISTDSGVTWAETQPAGDVDKDWQGAALDSDGSNLIAMVDTGRLYTGVNTAFQPPSDAVLVKRLVAVSENKFWYEDI